jgi:hypothetical protein
MTPVLLFGIAKVGIFSLPANFSAQIYQNFANFMVFGGSDGDFEIVLVTSQSYVQGKLHICHPSAQA